MQTNNLKRKKDSGPFVLKLFGFGAKQSAPASVIQRATASRVREGARAINGFLLECSEVAAGEIFGTHSAMSLPRQPVGATLTLPSSAAFRQMQHPDAVRATNRHAAIEPEFCLITVRLNGSSDLQLLVNARELREALGLSPYSLSRGYLLAFCSPTRACRRHVGRRPLERIRCTGKAKTRTHAFDKIFLAALVQTVGTHLC
ncbi:hypothetical protein PybrP1_006021 [[Pythium] brassicae (nom. inval.)]|nr:hypothetical protein PybrP1_006021 [[Pythium] brassicae (nom. inval.)]